jgi:predicted ATPase/DNA-binding SARP family transcriptional activator
VRIGVLGTLDGPSGLSGVRLRGLLARLALDAGRPVSAATLVEDLWETPPDNAVNALQALVSRLRRALGSGLVATEPGGYRLAVEPGVVDAMAFDALVTEAAGASAATAHTLLGDALALWRGPALADLSELPFAGPTAVRLSERRALAVEERARLALRLGLDPDVDALTTQLAAAPLRETTAALLGRALHAVGRQADALATLDRTIAGLAEDLGMDPGPELATARMAVLRALPPAPRTAGLSSFVGRTADVDRIRALLRTARLVTLTGPGGAGKTRLAREATFVPDGRRVASAPPSATFAGSSTGTTSIGSAEAVVAELAALTDGAQLPATLLAAVGEPELHLGGAEAPDPATRLFAALEGRDTILVLDNCEHLVAAAAALTESLLLACPRLRVVATSREPLGVPGEVLHPVDALAEADAMVLFSDRAAAVRPGFVVTAAVRPAVTEICRRLDGQPLAIELAAARLRTLSPAEIAARLDDRFRLLTTGARTALPRHQTLRAVVDWSWDLLDDPERAVARRLGVFAGGATLTAAERVCGPDALDVLTSLVDKSLVVAVPQADGPTRYRMLETIRAYAGEKLDAAGERPDAEAAHAAFLLELVEEAEPHIRGPEQLRWLARLRAEGEEIDLALRRAIPRDAATAHRIVDAMTWSWMVRGRMEEAARWLLALPPPDDRVPESTRALTYAYLALIRLGTGDGAEAKRSVEQAIGVAAALPQPWHPVLQLAGPVLALFGQRDPGPIQRLVAETSDPWVRAFALAAQGQIAENEGDIERQRQLIRTAHKEFAALGDRFGLGMVVHGLGDREDTTGNYAAAAKAYDESIALARELGNEEDLPQFIARRAQLEARRGDIAAARAVLDTAVGPQSRGIFGVSAVVPLARAQIERMAGNIDIARAQLALATPVPNGENDIAVPQRVAHHALITAQIDLAADDLPAAREQLRTAVEAAVEGNDGPVSALVAEAAAQLAHAEGDDPGAAELLGVAAAQRGTLDLGSPDVIAVLQAVRAALGPRADDLMSEWQSKPRPDGLAHLTGFASRSAHRP